MFDIITTVTTNLFRTYIMKRFMGIFFVQDAGEKKKEYIGYGLFYMVTILVYLLFHYPPANVAANILMMFIIVCIYESSWKKKILVTLLIYGINMLCDVIAIYSFSDYMIGGDYNLVAVYITVLLFALCEFLFEKFLVKQKNEAFVTPHWNAILLVPEISIALLLVLVMNNLNNQRILVIVSVGILVINLLVFYMYNALIAAYRKVGENIAFERQIASYANQLDVLMQSEEKVTALRHDMKHHLNELYRMSKNNINTEVMEYISNMQNFMSSDMELVRSGNREIDSILNYMLGKAKKILDRVEYKVNIPKDVLLKPFDITVLFGNLLENAIEAAEKSQGEKWLSLSLQYEKGLLFVSIENSYLSVKKRGMAYCTTKSEEGHGIGLQNVERIVASYQGTMEIADNNKVFSVKILLYL